jgi:hypothetical protein
MTAATLRGRRFSRQAKLGLATLMTISAVLGLSSQAQASTHDYCVGCTISPGAGYPDNSSFYLTGSYVREIGCLCHTVGAAAAYLGSPVYATGTAFHGYAGSTYTFAYAINGTGSVTILADAHADY